MKLTIKQLSPSQVLKEKDSSCLLVIPVTARPSDDASAGKKGFQALSALSQQLIREWEPAFAPLDLRRILEERAPTFTPKTRVAVFPVATTACGGLRLSTLSKEAALGERLQLDEWRRVGGDSYQAATMERATTLRVVIPELSAKVLAEVLQAVTEGAVLASYRFDEFKVSSRKSDSSVRSLQLLIASKPTQNLLKAVEAGEKVARAVCMARDLVNTPPSDLPPRKIAQHARGLASRSRLKAKIFDKSQLQKLGAGGLLGVARGSDEPPYMVHLSLSPKRRTKAAKTIVLIGKGVTFDSGGLSIKPGKSMEDMKCDMAGGAAVLAVMEILAGLPDTTEHEVHGIIPTTENMVNGDSVKPGDVLRALNGKTIEVLNTDAEGRLILADALAYAERLGPDIIIDLATLTGACIVALGGRYAGLFSNDEGLTEKLESAAKIEGELFWELPLAPEYRPELESPVADLRNIGTGGPGATLGALFLEEFVPKNTAWAHLDIAGPAFASHTDEYTKKGGTGFGIRTLLRWLEEV